MVFKRLVNNPHYFLIVALLLVLCSGLRFGTQGLVVNWTENVRGKTLLYEGPNLILAPNEALQQTFTANYPGLNQIDILVQGETSTQQLEFRLKKSCDAAEILRQTTFAILPEAEPFFQPITFPPVEDSAGQSYCLVLQTRQSAVSLSSVFIPGPSWCGPSMYTATPRSL